MTQGVSLLKNQKGEKMDTKKMLIGLSVTIVLLLTGCATKNDGVGLFSEQKKLNTYSLVLPLKGKGETSIPLCENGNHTTRREITTARGYYPTSISQDNNGTTKIEFNILSESYSLNVNSCYMDEDKDTLVLEIEDSNSEIDMITRVGEMDLDNAVKIYH